MRPLKFKNAKALQKEIDAYFESCFDEEWYQNSEGVWKAVYDRNGEIVKNRIKPYTITGLAVYIGTTRQGLLNYEQRDEFYDTIKQAKDKIQSFVEESLWQPKIATGVIFNLKNNFGWEDKQEIKQSGGTTNTQNVVIEQDLSKLSTQELEQLNALLAKSEES